MTYSLGTKSLAELNGVHPALIEVVKHAITITAVDFSVHDGLRTEAEQSEYVAKGVSQTMNSKHRPQADGFGHAVDLVPYINGKLRWELQACCAIAEAVREAAELFGTRIRWGGCWQELNGTSAAPMAMIEQYADTRRKLGKRAFIDAPHWEIISL